MAKDALVSIQFWSHDSLSLNVERSWAGGSTGNEGREADPVRGDGGRVKKNGLKWESQGINVDWIRWGMQRLCWARGFWEVWSGQKRKESRMKKKGGCVGGDTPTPPLWITVQKSYPISRVGWSWWPTAPDQPIDRELVWWGIVELFVCNPHSLLFCHPYLCKMDFYSTWRTVCSCVLGCVCCGGLWAEISDYAI